MYIHELHMAADRLVDGIITTLKTVEGPSPSAEAGAEPERRRRWSCVPVRTWVNSPHQRSSPLAYRPHKRGRGLDTPYAGAWDEAERHTQHCKGGIIRLKRR